MKLPPLAIVVLLLSPAIAAHCTRRHRRTLSATTKKPASLAGFLYLIRSNFRLIAAFLSRALTSPHPSAPKLTIQTPSSL